MLLYQPSAHEILATAARVRLRQPDMASRINKAASILADVNANFDTDDDDNAWRIRSQTEPNIWHIVSSSGCTCEDYHRGAGESGYCKHLHAYYAYRRLLANDLNRRLIGNLKWPSDRQRAKMTPGSMLLVTDGMRARVCAYSSYYRFPRHVCFTRLDSSERLVPHNPRDFIALSEWIAEAPSFAMEQPAPDMDDFKNVELAPEFTPRQFRHWLDTGDTPAMRNSF